MPSVGIGTAGPPLAAGGGVAPEALAAGAELAAGAVAEEAAPAAGALGAAAAVAPFGAFAALPPDWAMAGTEAPTATRIARPNACRRMISCSIKSDAPRGRRVP